MQLTLISFPRSGQHLTERILKFYCKANRIKFSYCEFYTHCQTTPCKSKRLFQKNHDFDLKLPIDPGNKYLVLYRSNMIEQLEAWFRYELDKKWNLQHNKQDINYNYCEKRSALISFIDKNYSWIGRTRGEYYLGFIKKWVMSSNKNILRVEYNSFLEKPDIFLSVFIHFFPNLDHSQDKKILSDFCKKEPIKKQTKVNLDFN